MSSEGRYNLAKPETVRPPRATNSRYNLRRSAAHEGTPKGGGKKLREDPSQSAEKRTGVEEGWRVGKDLGVSALYDKAPPRCQGATHPVVKKMKKTRAEMATKSNHQKKYFVLF